MISSDASAGPYAFTTGTDGYNENHLSNNDFVAASPVTKKYARLDKPATSSPLSNKLAT